MINLRFLVSDIRDIAISIVQNQSKQELQNTQQVFNYNIDDYPLPGSAEELLQFEKIQHDFAKQFELFFPDNLHPKPLL